MKKIMLTLQYDGTNYHGWQRQSDLTLPTIQGEVERVLKIIYQQDINLISAGRTDRGVHAEGQVATFEAQEKIPIAKLVYALNNILAKDIVVIGASEVPKTFHARYHAQKKWYRYTVYNHPIGNVFQRNYSLHVNYSLYVDKMKEASQYFVGEHNFQAFCSARTGVKTFTRTMEKCTITKNHNLIYFDFVANGFLYNMVRIIVGTLLEVGRGKLQPIVIPRIILNQDRSKAGPTAAPEGLCLKKVFY